MCGICGIASERGSVDPERLRAMATTLFHRGPDSEGTHLDGPVGIAARRLAIIDLTGGDQPIANEDGSVVVVQNGEIYNYRELMRELERAGHTFRTRCDTEVLVHGYEEWGPELVGAAARDVRGRGVGRTAQAADARARPLRDQAAVLPRRRRRAVVRVGARRAAAGRDRPRRTRGVPRVQLDPRTALDLPRHPQAAARPHADLARGSRRPRPLRAHRAAAGTPRRGRGRARRGMPRAPARLGARAPGRRRAGRRAALRRRRLRCARRARRRGVVGSGAHVLDRLRGGVVRRAGRRARGRAALRDDSPRARPASRRGAAPAGARRRVRRAVRRLVGAPDVPRLEARGRGRQGRALRRGQRRALRRLLHLRRRPARRADRPARLVRAAARRPAADVDRAARASTTRRSASHAPRTCRRSSAITAGRRSSPPTHARS